MLALAPWVDQAWAQRPSGQSKEGKPAQSGPQYYTYSDFLKMTKTNKKTEGEPENIAATWFLNANPEQVLA